MASFLSDQGLSFTFRGRAIPVTFSSSISREEAELAVESEVFRNWSKRCEKENDGKRLEINSVELQNVDMFGPR